MRHSSPGHKFRAGGRKPYDRPQTSQSGPGATSTPDLGIRPSFGGRYFWIMSPVFQTWKNSPKATRSWGGVGSRLLALPCIPLVCMGQDNASAHISLSLLGPRSTLQWQLTSQPPMVSVGSKGQVLSTRALSPQNKAHSHGHTHGGSHIPQIQP